MIRNYGNYFRNYRATGRNRLGIFAFVPLRQVLAKPVSNACRRDSSGQADPLRVLVVEDEPLIRGMIVAMLFRQGWMARGAADGEEAFAVAETWRPHVAAIEWMLPGNVKSCSVAEQLRAFLPRMGIIFLAEWPVEALYPQIRSLAPCALVEKPWEWEELAWAVRRVARAKQDFARWPR